jgi:hypothetical protein
LQKLGVPSTAAPQAGHDRARVRMPPSATGATEGVGKIRNAPIDRHVRVVLRTLTRVSRTGEDVMGRHFARFWGIALAAVLFTPVGAGAIIGGDVDETDRYSKVGFVVELKDGVPVDGCTGTLISETVVETAAHCLADRLAYAVTFEPTVDFSPDERLIGVSEYRINDEYDVAVLHLARDATVVFRGIHPAGLPDERALDEYRKGDSLTHVGYGLDRVPRRQSSPTLSGFTRRSLTASLSRLSRTQLFTRSPDGALCDGDSGGPVFDGDGVIVALGNYVSGNCKGTNSGPRLDIEPVRDFLSDNGVPVPN